MFKSANGREFERITRLLEIIKPGKTYSVDDMKAMQLDALSLRARSEVPTFKGWTSAAPAVERARQLLAAWDAVYARESAAAALFNTWRAESTADERDAARPIETRKPLLEASLGRAIDRLSTSQGADWASWRWGRMHTQAFPHPLVAAFNLPSIERRGGAGTVAADGASYREILDVANWDRSVVTNVPGQSGQPEGRFYANLLPLFGSDTYFPLVFSRAEVEKASAERLRLRVR